MSRHSGSNLSAVAKVSAAHITDKHTYMMRELKCVVYWNKRSENINHFSVGVLNETKKYRGQAVVLE